MAIVQEDKARQLPKVTATAYGAEYVEAGTENAPKEAVKAPAEAVEVPEMAFEIPAEGVAEAVEAPKSEKKPKGRTPKGKK